MIKVNVNGKTEEIKELLLKEYLENKNLDSNNIIVLLNNEIIKRENFSTIFLKNNDVLEILKFIGGG